MTAFAPQSRSSWSDPIRRQVSHCLIPGPQLRTRREDSDLGGFNLLDNLNVHAVADVAAEYGR